MSYKTPTFAPPFGDKPSLRWACIMKQSIQPLNRAWFMGHGFTKIPDGVLPRTFYIKVTNEHPEGIIVNEYGQRMTLRKIKMTKRKQETYYELNFRFKGRDYHVCMHYLVFCTFHHIPTKGNHIDHIDGSHFNNRPSNLREVTPAINHRDGGFCKLSRNRGIDPVQFPAKVLLAYFEILAEYRSLNSRWKYSRLTRDDLLGFLAKAATRVANRKFIIGDPHEFSDREISRHCEGNL